MTVPASCAALSASIATSAQEGERAEKIPPVWNQRTPLEKTAFQSMSPGFMWLAAEWPRSYIVTLPRTPVPTSVKLSPTRSALPTPS